MDASDSPSPDIPDPNVWASSLADRGQGEPLEPLPGRNDDNQGQWPDNRGAQGLPPKKGVPLYVKACNAAGDAVLYLVNAVNVTPPA